jgi:hypothetical protein
VFFVMRVMPFVMGEDMSRFAVCRCVVSSGFLGFVGDVVDDLGR